MAIKNEMDGFVLYKPAVRCQTGMFVRISKNSVRFSEDVIRVMGSTGYLVLFTDDNTQRIMVQPAKKGTANALRLNKGNTFMQKTVIDMIRKMAELENGEKSTIYGHKVSWATNPSIIFNMKQRKEKSDDAGNNQIDG